MKRRASLLPSSAQAAIVSATRHVCVSLPRTAQALILAIAQCVAAVALSSGSSPAHAAGLLVGRWLQHNVGDCPLVFDSDDGTRVEANCNVPGFRHLFHARYTAPDRLELVGERIDPSGCKASATGTIRIVDSDHLVTTFVGWDGCGLHPSTVPGALVRETATAGGPLPMRPASASESGLPEFLHECDSNCNTLQLYHGDYMLVTRYPWDVFDGPIVWTVESFTPQSVKLHRRYPVDQVFEGPMSTGGSAVDSVRINGQPSNVRIAWGASLNSVYGSNAERDRALIPEANRKKFAFLELHARQQTCPPREQLAPFQAPSWALKPDQVAVATSAQAAAFHDVFTRCFLDPQDAQESKSFAKHSRQMDEADDKERQDRLRLCREKNPGRTDQCD